MLIGKLNSPSFPISYTVTKKDLEITLSPLEDGDPFAGETMRFGWKSLIDSGIDLHVSLPRKILLNTVAVGFAQDGFPCQVSLYTKGKQMLLSRYSAETGKQITQAEITLPVDEDLTDFVLEICGDFTDLAPTYIDLYGAIWEDTPLFPTPDVFRKNNGHLCVTALKTCSCHWDAAMPAICILQEKYADITGCSLTVCHEGDIRLMQDAGIAAGGYRLSVTAQGVTVSASDLRGFVMGVESLCKLVVDGRIPVCTIEDAPFVDFRGVHLYLPAPEEIPFTKRLIKHIL